MNEIELIEEFRNARGWSVNRLAEEAGIQQSTLQSILDRGKSLKVDTLKRICKGLDVTLSQFFMTDEQKETVSSQEKILLDEFRKLPMEKKKALIALLAD
ncbi:MAG: helix-turn-helix domain-containing protein [Clostridia bacterium]|nr:helix-turn-helix domain-containing protein [Clostridia bacterium]